MKRENKRQKVQLDEYFYIEFDRHGMHLIKEVETDRKFKDTEKNIVQSDEWHYGSNLKLVLNRYVNEAIKSSDSIDAILKKLEEIENNINKLELNKNN